MSQQRILSLFEVLTAFINIVGWTSFFLVLLTIYVFEKQLGQHTFFMAAVACVIILLLVIWNLLYTITREGSSSNS